MRYCPFLDVLVSRRPDSLLGRTVYRKPIHTDLYINARSEHHPSRKMLYQTLIQRATTICNVDSLDMAISHLKRTFRHNGYSNLEVLHMPASKQNEKVARMAILLHQQAVCNRISRLLA
jgi:hypothetical protein